MSIFDLYYNLQDVTVIVYFGRKCHSVAQYNHNVSVFTDFPVYSFQKDFNHRHEDINTIQTEKEFCEIRQKDYKITRPQSSVIM